MRTSIEPVPTGRGIHRWLLVAAAVLGTAGSPHAQDAAGFAAAAASAAAAGRDAQAVSVRGGAPEWLFLVNELEHLGKGEFWEDFPQGNPVAVIAAYNMVSRFLVALDIHTEYDEE